MVDTKLTELLVAENKVTEPQVQQATQLQAATGGDLGDVLVKLGFIDAETLATFRSKVEGVEHVDISDMVLPDALVQSIPREVIQKHRVIPIKKDHNTITLAMSDAENFEAIEEVQFVTGMKVSTVIASKESITRAITRFFDELDHQEESEDEDAAVGVAADTGEVELQAETDEVNLTELGVTDWSHPRYLRALLPLLMEKGIITEAELRERANAVEASSAEGEG